MLLRVHVIYLKGTGGKSFGKPAILAAIIGAMTHDALYRGRDHALCSGCIKFPKCLARPQTKERENVPNSAQLLKLILLLLSHANRPALGDQCVHLLMVGGTELPFQNLPREFGRKWMLGGVDGSPQD